MKFGIRKPSLKRRFAARTSLKRMVRAKVRMPRGGGFLTNPDKAAYNAIYHRTSVSVDKLPARSTAKSSSWFLWLILLLLLPITWPFILLWIGYKLAKS